MCLSPGTHNTHMAEGLARRLRLGWPLRRRALIAFACRGEFKDCGASSVLWPHDGTSVHKVDACCTCMCV